MVVSLNLITDIYGLPNPKTGKQKIIKRNVCFKKTFDTNTMQVQHYIDDRGIVSQKYCLVSEGEKDYKAVHKFEELERLVSPTIIKGFKW